MRLRFSIRDLLWLTLVVALAAGWWVDRATIWRQRARQLVIAKELALEHLREVRANETGTHSEWAPEAAAREQYLIYRAQFNEAMEASANPLTALFK